MVGETLPDSYTCYDIPKYPEYAYLMAKQYHETGMASAARTSAAISRKDLSSQPPASS